MSKQKSKGPSKTRGYRNNNPGNLEWGSPWQGLRPESDRTDDRFCQFISATYGIRALACVLITYQDKRRAKDGSRIDSVREFIERWAPPNENDTTSYSASVAALLDGVGPSDEVIDVHNYDHLRPLVEGIIRHENGRGPFYKNANGWYSDAEIDEGLRRAGVVRKKPSVKDVASKATIPVGAAIFGADQLSDVLPAITDAAGAGVDALANALPSVVTAVEGARDDLTSGSMIRLALGSFAVGCAVVIAWQKYRQTKIESGGWE
ncbi:MULTISPECIES: hypothetical protein [unclassified Aeromonas]|uniref:hypothetical protein n=1 Tax=unclassified Aeromonas TaxID=257493 RepID=UPI0022E0D4EF|nr:MULTISPECIES: hypothetical protein [unclassified Aeromonas]